TAPVDPARWTRDDKAKASSVGRLADALGVLTYDRRRQFGTRLFQLRFDLNALRRVAVVGFEAQFFNVDFEVIGHRHLLDSVKDDAPGS
ncbi:MAG: hypothetical protein KKB72_18130, partial [Alphaproteobacteria bacterium]|nr:hypothetical protein [Alphaproteobacteria bacterium]